VSELWQHNRPFAIAVLTWVGGGLLFFFAVHLPFSGPVSELRRDSRRRAELARHFAPAKRASPDTVPFSDAKRALAAEQAELAAALAAARRRIEFVPPQRFNIAADVAERPLEYSKIRKAAASELRDLANRASVVIPSELDPRNNSKSLPRKDEIDELLLRLAMTDRIVRAAVAARVPRVASIVHKPGAPRGSPLAQRFVRVKLEGELDQIVRFIGKCSTPPDARPAAPTGAGAAPGTSAPPAPGGGVLIVRTVEIANSGNGSTLAADIELAAVTVLKVKPRPRARAASAVPQPVRRARPSW